MKRLLAALALLAMSYGAYSVLPADAAGPNSICYTTDNTNCIPVSPTTPFPVTGTVTSSVSGTVSVTGTVTAGSALQTSSTPTVQASGYTAGNCIGGFNAVTATNNNGQTGFVTNFRASSLTGLTPTFTVYLFDSQPTTSICTDKGTFTLSAADTDKLIAAPTAITLAAPSNVTTPSVASLDFTPPRPFIAGGSTSSGVKTVYYGIVTSAITPASTSEFHLRIGTALN